MASDPNDWRSGKNMGERLIHAAELEQFADCAFIFENKEDGSKKVLRSQRFHLSQASPVFEAMFYGPAAEANPNNIVISDFSYDTIKHLFRLVFSNCAYVLQTDDAETKVVAMMQIYTAADKYQIGDVIAYCCEQLPGLLTPANVLSVYEFATFFDEKGVVKSCREVIQKQTEAVLKSPNFKFSDKKTLQFIVSQDTLNIESETSVIQAVINWGNAHKKSDNQPLHKVLGQEITGFLRILSLSNKELIDLVQPSTLFTKKQLVDILTYKVNPDPKKTIPEILYPSTSLKLAEDVVFTICREDSSRDAYLIKYNVNRQVVLHGVVCNFHRCCQNQYYYDGNKKNIFTLDFQLCKTNTLIDSQVTCSYNAQFSNLVLWQYKVVFMPNELYALKVTTVHYEGSSAIVPGESAWDITKPEWRSIFPDHVFTATPLVSAGVKSINAIPFFIYSIPFNMCTRKLPEC